MSSNRTSPSWGRCACCGEAMSLIEVHLGTHLCADVCADSMWGEHLGDSSGVATVATPIPPSDT